MLPMNQQLIKATNMKTLFTLIQREKAVSRIALAKTTHLSKATVSALVDELIAGGYVVDCGTGKSATTGRKPNTLMVNGELNYVAVFQWNKAVLSAALISLDNRVIFEMRISMDKRMDYAQATVRTLREDLETYNPQAKILGVCVIIPGIADKASKRLLSTVLKIDNENDVLQFLNDEISDYPITVLNDTACYAYAECVHSDMEDTYYAFVNIGTGIGAVMLERGRIFRAANGMTTQFGHFSVNRKGSLCDCGNRGCLEREIGEMFLYERSEREGCAELFQSEDDANFATLGFLAEEGEPKAKKLLNALAEDMAYAMSNLISLFNPQEIVIGGNGMALGPLYLEAVSKHLSKMGFPLFMKHVSLRFSHLNKSSLLNGAARYYIDQYFSFDGEMQNTLFIG